MTTFSIIVCAYNAVSRLQKTLEHLHLIDYPADLIEIIIVDNNSSDGTADFADKIWSQTKSLVPLKIVREVTQGLSYARKRGLCEATFDYVVFCDDDNWLDEHYLRFADELLAENSSIGVLGGQGIPVTDAACFPNWFYTYSGGYAVGVQSLRSEDISDRGFVWGAGAVMRRDFLSKAFSAGCELLLSGRNGEKLLAGDDSELCKWFLVAGYRLWYDERMLFQHFIPKERLTAEYLHALFRGFGETKKILERYDQYLHHQPVRRKWTTNPVVWIKREIELLVDRDENKLKVFRLSNRIKRLK